MVAVAVGDGDFGAVFFAGGDKAVRLGGRAAKGFLKVDAHGSGLDGSERHVVMLICVTGADGDEPGFHLSQHLAVISESLVDLEFGQFLFQPSFIFVSDRDDFRLGNLEPDGVEPMAEIAAAGVSDDGDAMFP